MKNLLSVENLVSTTAKEARLFDLEFFVGGKRVFIKGAKLYGNSGMPFDDYLNYWHEEKNIKRAIEWAEPEDIEVIGELDKLDAEEDIKSILAAKDFEGILDEIADIAADLENNSTDLAKRLDSVALTLQKQDKTANKGATSVSDPKSEVVLTAKQLADLGEMLLTNKRMLEFQNHALALVKPLREIDREYLIIHYHELYRLTEDMFGANQEVVRTMDMAAFLLLESTNKDEIDAHYNE